MSTLTRPGSGTMTNKVSTFVDDFMGRVKERNPHEPEFLQAVREVVGSLVVVIQKHPEYRKANILARMVEPERVIQFRVPWMDDTGDIHVHRGIRVEFSSAIGPYKG